IVPVGLEIVNRVPSASITGPSTGLKGATLTFIVNATDPSAADQAAGFTFRIDWNSDGVVDQTVSGPSGLAVDHVFGAAGLTTIIVRATDKDSGASDPANLSVNVINTPPTANAGGPYSVGEGQATTLNGSGSGDPDGTIVAYEWDLDYDG